MDVSRGIAAHHHWSATTQSPSMRLSRWASEKGSGEAFPRGDMVRQVREFPTGHSVHRGSFDAWVDFVHNGVRTLINQR